MAASRKSSAASPACPASCAPDSTTRTTALNVAWNDGAAPEEVMARLSALGYRAHPYARRPWMRMSSSQVAAALPRRCRLRGHERDAAFSLGVGRKCQRHHPGNARSFPLGVGAHRPARRRLCRPALLPLRPERPAHAPAQHGRAHFAGRHPRAGHVGGGNAPPSGTRLFRQRAHAAVLPAGGAAIWTTPRASARAPSRPMSPPCAARWAIGWRRMARPCSCRFRRSQRVTWCCGGGRAGAGGRHRGDRPLQPERSRGDGRDPSARRRAGRYGPCRQPQW